MTPFLTPGPGSPFEVYPKKPFCDTRFPMGIYVHIKNQNSLFGASPDIFSRCYSQISGISGTMIKPPGKMREEWKLLFGLDLGFFEAESIDTALEENAETVFVAFILIGNLSILH